MGKWLTSKVVAITAGVLLVSVLMSWVLYVLFGHQLIEILYRGELTWLRDKIMRSRGIYPVDAYYDMVDEWMLVWTFRALWVVALFLLLAAFIRRPVGAVLVCASLFASSFFLFYLFDLFPSLIKLLSLHTIPYYYFQYHYQADDELAYRRRPFRGRILTPNFRGDFYSPRYGVEVPPIIKTDWVTDADGFRNSRPAKLWDVIAIGDSYLEDGTGEADTFPKRLENKLPGLTVANLGVGGYGPIQYLEVLKRYGIKKHPEYALFSFFEGNDIQDIRVYLRWRKGEAVGAYKSIYDSLSSQTLFRRYAVAAAQTAAYVKERAGKEIWLAVQAALATIDAGRGNGRPIHPDLAVLKMGNNYHTVLLSGVFWDTRSTDDMLKTEEWQVLKKILDEFRDVCAENKIIPIIVYIPTNVHIYAEYSTEQSGRNWRRMRDEQIAAQGDTESAMRHLSQELNIDLISLTPVFKLAAEQGRLLYYPFDSHWNSDGKELAASFVADVLKLKYPAASNSLKGDR